MTDTEILDYLESRLYCNQAWQVYDIEIGDVCVTINKRLKQSLREILVAAIFLHEAKTAAQVKRRLTE